MMRQDDGPIVVLEETLAANEEELRKLVLETPSLLPLEEMGISGPPVVVGRESTLDSGRVDLVVLARGGELLIVEFKTGPQNSDFRDSLAQLLDYGSELWSKPDESRRRRGKSQMG
jgi:RecB family endonuclease NucS